VTAELPPRFLSQLNADLSLWKPMAVGFASRATIPAPASFFPANPLNRRAVMADDSPQEIAAKFLEKLKDSPFVMIGLNDGQHSEPMTAQIDDDQPNTLFFFAGKDNRIAGGGQAMAQFVGKGHDFFACLSGHVSKDNDPAQIDKLWDKQVEAWFPQGKSDPNMTLLRFDINSAELWETDISLSGRVKMLFGGTIRSDESSSHAVVGSVA